MRQLAAWRWLTTTNERVTPGCTNRREMGAVTHKLSPSTSKHSLLSQYAPLLCWFRHFLTAAIYARRKIKDARGRPGSTDDRRAHRAEASEEVGGHFLLIWKTKGERNKPANVTYSETKKSERQRGEKRAHKSEREKGKIQRLWPGDRRVSSFTPVAQDSIKCSSFLTMYSLSKQGPCFAPLN